MPNFKKSTGFKMGRKWVFKLVTVRLKLNLVLDETNKPTIPGTPIIAMPLAEGIMGEANMDGTIYVSNQLNPNSFEYRQTINHEMRHATDMKLGKLAYDDDHIMYNGERFERQDINGVDSILVDGKWKEAGDTGFPWENDANNGNE
jgi:hypothetical protein